jgi:hypothetical protein
MFDSFSERKGMKEGQKDGRTEVRKEGRKEGQDVDGDDVAGWKEKTDGRKEQCIKTGRRNDGWKGGRNATRKGMA